MKENYPDDKTVLTGTACPVFPAIYEDENFRFGLKLRFYCSFFDNASQKSY